MNGYVYRGTVTLDQDPAVRRDRARVIRPAAPDAPADVSCRICGRSVRSTGLPVCAAHVPDELGITYRQLDYWSRSGYLRPGRDAHTRRRASGCFRIWAESELRVARLMGRLASAGIIPETAARIARSGERRTEVAPGIMAALSASRGCSSPGSALTGKRISGTWPT